LAFCPTIWATSTLKSRYACPVQCSFQEKEIFDCIVVEAPWQKQLEYNSEGELDGESDLSDAESEGMNEEAVSEVGMRMEID
jgi:hypothetical protein